MIATIERAAHLIAAYLEHALEELGVTHAEAHVLAQLARRGSTPIAILHREFGRKPSTLTNVIDRLENRGFVRREINRADRRSFVIHLTASGKRAAKRVRRVVDELEGRVAAAINGRDLQGLDAVARALAAAGEELMLEHRDDRRRRPPRSERD
jgi:MarR family transcriptional regulator, organic hydroperoxide resistance regulator